MAGIYIHVPYCKTRCIYCDFFTQTNSSSQSDYILALAKEIELRKTYLKGAPIQSIYFGGGTPSQLNISEISCVLDSIYRNYDVSSDTEITLETNPDDLTNEYSDKLITLGFNRLSMGVQSFNDSELQFLNRRHDAQSAIDAVEKAQNSGFKNISIDLIYGLPNQTLDIWKNNLEKAINLDIQHISSYHLIYEKGTKLSKLVKSGDVNPIDEDLSLDMFSALIDKLTNNGFEHYEISNFAKSKKYSSHNTSYWQNEKYLGLGPAAHSFDGENRAWNVSSISKYIAGIKAKKLNIEIEILDINAQYNDFILTGMRTMWGVNLDILLVRFGQEKLDYCLDNIQKHIQAGTVSRIDNILKLNKSGIFLSDDIMSDLMYIKD